MNNPTPEQAAAAVAVLVNALSALRPAIVPDAWEPRVRSAILASCSIVARLSGDGPSPAALTATSALGLAAAELLARTLAPDDADAPAMH